MCHFMFYIIMAYTFEDQIILMDTITLVISGKKMENANYYTIYVYILYLYFWGSKVNKSVMD